MKYFIFLWVLILNWRCHVVVFLYFLIGIFASIVGTITGLGAGVIVKPILDYFQHYDLATINFLSSVTVLVMSGISLLVAKRGMAKVNKTNSTYIAIGSVIGGLMGKDLFGRLTQNGIDTDVLGTIQSILLLVIFVLILYFVKHQKDFKTYDLQNKMLIIAVGFSLGLIGSFLGIGGGPLNMVVLSWLFSMDMKNAAVNSLFIIVFSQSSAILLVLFTADMSTYKLVMLPVMVIGGVLGGLIGSRSADLLNNKRIQLLFNGTLIFIISITLFTIVLGFFSA